MAGELPELSPKIGGSGECYYLCPIASGAGSRMSTIVYIPLFPSDTANASGSRVNPIVYMPPSSQTLQMHVGAE